MMHEAAKTKNSFLADDSLLLYVEGMHCHSCVHLIENLPKTSADIKSARVHFGDSTVSIQTAAHFSLTRILEDFKQLGYKARILKEGELSEVDYKLENRTYLAQIAVAGACTGNIMLFSIPVYTGLSTEWTPYFLWLSFFLFLPILIYSAQSLFKGAWNSLRHRQLNIDLPIVIALLLGFSLSTYNLILGKSEVYFDSTASFLFLILSSRFFLKRIQQRYLYPRAIPSFLQISHFDFWDEKSSSFVEKNISALQAKDIFRLSTDSILPVDAILLEPKAEFDGSVWSGESLPQFYNKGMRLPAGLRLLSGPARFEAASEASESSFAKLLREVEQAATQNNPYTVWSDRLSQYLIGIVFFTALVFFIYYMQIDWQEGLRRALALLIVACPCALALGTPLTFGLAVKKAQKKGILLKDGAVLEEILKIKNIFFDKTGTLTEGRLKLVRSQPEVLSDFHKNLVLQMESSSHHPIAFAFREIYSASGEDLHLTHCQEDLGFGISAECNGRKYQLARHISKTASSYIHSDLLENGEQIARFYFEDKIRKETPMVLTEIRKSFQKMKILSGDSSLNVRRVAEACNFPVEDALGGLNPEEKAKILQVNQPALMIGDGANDAVALQTAHIGIAVHGSIDISFQAADVYFTKPGLSSLLDLLKISRSTRNTLIRNITISLIYNLGAGTLALMGYVDPLLAAILMPISSAVILANSFWGTK